jgi:hypothetical protein
MHRKIPVIPLPSGFRFAYKTQQHLIDYRTYCG